MSPGDDGEIERVSDPAPSPADADGTAGAGAETAESGGSSVDADGGVSPVDLTSPGGPTSLDSLLANPTPPSPPPPAVSSSSRTNVLQSVGVGEVSPRSPSPSAGSSLEPPPTVSYTGSSGGLLLHIPVDAIQPNEFQPRRRFDEDSLAALTESVRELGVLQPVLVRRLSAPRIGPESTVEFELVAGERRWRAARRAGLSKLPAVVRDVSDRRSLEEAIVENLHRSDLNPLEEAAAYQQLINEFGLTQSQVAQRVGKSRSAVANTLRLVQLPVSVQRLVVSGQLSAGHARAVLAVPSYDQPPFARRILDDDLSVRQAEELAQNWSRSSTGSAEGVDHPVSGGRSGNGQKEASAGALEVAARLSRHLETRVRVDELAAGGRVVIEYADDDDLDRIFQMVLGGPNDPRHGDKGEGE